MGLFDWLRRKDAGATTVTTFTVTTRDVSVDAADAQDPAQREAFEEAGRVIHEFFAAGSSLEAATTVVVDGSPVTADDPRARAAIGEAAAKLRAQGLGELAAELEARLAAAPAAGEPRAAAGPELPAAGAPVADAALPASEAAQTAGPGEAPSAPAPPEPPAPPG